MHHEAATSRLREGGGQTVAAVVAVELLTGVRVDVQEDARAGSPRPGGRSMPFGSATIGRDFVEILFCAPGVISTARTILGSIALLPGASRRRISSMFTTSDPWWEILTWKEGGGTEALMIAMLYLSLLDQKIASTSAPSQLMSWTKRSIWPLVAWLLGMFLTRHLRALRIVEDPVTANFGRQSGPS